MVVVYVVGFVLPVFHADHAHVGLIRGVVSASGHGLRLLGELLHFDCGLVLMLNGDILAAVEHGEEIPLGLNMLHFFLGPDWSLSFGRLLGFLQVVDGLVDGSGPPPLIDD